MKRFYTLLFLLILFPVFVYPLDIHKTTADATPGWTYMRTNTSHNFALLSTMTVKINADTTLEEGDYVGVFFDSLGVQACAGYIIWPADGSNVNLAVWGDSNGDDGIKDGFFVGETINWKVWQKKSGRVFPVQATVYTGPTTFATDGMSVISSIVAGSTVLPPWYKNTSGATHTILIPAALKTKIKGIDLAYGDYLGVFFDSSGTTACGGYEDYKKGINSILTAYGDDPTVSGKQGFNAGEVFKWKVWRASDNKVFDMKAYYTKQGFANDSTFMENGVSSLDSLVYAEPAAVLPPWYKNTSNITHTILIPAALKPKIKGTSLTDGDYLGVFFDSTGTAACGGYVGYTTGTNGILTAYGDDVTIDGKQGFDAGEVFKWKVWRASDNKVFDMKAYYTKQGFANDSTFVENGASSLDSLVYVETAIHTVDTGIITISVDLQFGDGDITKSVNYRMIGLPCNGDVNGDPITLDNSIFSGRTANVDWVAFYDDGSDAYIPYSTAVKDMFTFSPGKAFWILSKYSLRLNEVKVKPVRAWDNGTYGIHLKKGWNMISNPFNYNIDWSKIVELNKNITDPIWDFNEAGKYIVPSGFIPYRGYYFYNRKGLDSLIIPAASITASKISAGSSTNDFELNNPIKISLKASQSELSEAYISIKAGSNNALDDFDQFLPPPNFEESEVYLYNEELNCEYKNLYIETRPEIGNGQAFDIRVKHTAEPELTLKFDGLEKYFLNEIYLINKRSLKFYNLKDNSTVSLSATYKSDEFILAIGSAEFFQGIKRDIKPIDYALNQNYPNPFNPTTTISWQLVSDSKVSLKVFDLLGREVITLVNETESAGNHQIQFSADKNKFSSGVYFYSIRAKALDGSKEFTANKKMLILK